MSRSETLILGSGSSRTESGSPVLTRCGDAHPHHLPVASQRPLPCSLLSTPPAAQDLQLLFLRSVSLSEQPKFWSEVEVVCRACRMLTGITS